METEKSKSWRESKCLLLIVVTTALFTDFMLVSTVVPIIPRYLYEIRHKNSQLNNTEDNWNFTEIKNTVNSRRQINVTADSNVKNTDENFNSTTDEFTIQSIKENQNENDNFKDSVNIGILFGAKPFVQIFLNPVVGPLIQKIGYGKPMFFGFVILFSSTVLFAFSSTYEMLLFARAFQGIGSSCTSVAGKSGLATRYTVQKERDNALRIAVGGTVLGIMCGPPFGSFMYQYFGKKSPFLVIAGLTLIDGVLQLLVKQPKKKHTMLKIKGPSVLNLITDPYIIIVVVGMFVITSEFALFETSLPLWMMDTMKPTQSELGIVFIPTMFGLLLIFFILGRYCLKMGRWLMGIVGMILAAISLATITLANNIYQLILPNFGLGLAFGVTQTALMPELPHLVDIRHTSVYGNVFAIADFFQSSGLAFGPVIGGFILKYVGFRWLMYGSALISFIYTSLIYFLRNPPATNKKSKSEEDTTNQLIKNSHEEK